MRFFVDSQLPPALAAWLRAKGHDAVAARDVGLREAVDTAIWAYAAQMSLIIITKDQDFADLASSSDGPVILWVRIGNVVNRVLFARFEAGWTQILEHLESGSSVVELR